MKMMFRFLVLGLGIAACDKAHEPQSESRKALSPVVESSGERTEVSPSEAEIFNVRRFGARGNGQDDDTVAILAAAAALSTLTDDVPKILYFPRGHYRISGAIEISHPHLYVRSEANAILEQSNPNKPILVFLAHSHAQRIKVRGLTFIGGSNQLSFRNLFRGETSRLRIEDCEFRDSTRYAIHTQGKDDDGPGRHFPGELSVLGSKFINGAGVLVNFCEQAVVMDTWVQTNMISSNTPAGMSKYPALFLNMSGRLIFENMFGVPNLPSLPAGETKHPIVAPADKRYWVEVRGGSFEANHSRFGAEGTNGFPVVLFKWEDIADDGTASFPFRPSFRGSTISIRNSLLTAGGAGAAVIKIARRVPQRIELVGNNFLLQSDYVQIENESEAASYLGSCWTNPARVFSFLFDQNMAIPSTNPVPCLLLSYVPGGRACSDSAKMGSVPRNSLEGPLRSAFRGGWTKADDPFPWGQESLEDDVVDVRLFGAKGDGLTDDTRAIRMAIAAVTRDWIIRRVGSGTVGSQRQIYFPAGNYRISQTLEVPLPFIRLYGDDGARIEQVSPHESIFAIRHPSGGGSHKVEVRNLLFVGGKHQLIFQNNNVNQTTLKITGCSFRDSSDYAIVALGTSKASAPNPDFHLSAIVVIRDSTFANSAGVLDNSADIATVRNSVLDVGANTLRNNTGLFLNRSGTLGLEDVEAIARAPRAGVSGLHWVRMDGGNLFTRRLHIKAKEGTGFPLAYFSSSGVIGGGVPGNAWKYPFMGSYIIFEESVFDAGGSGNAVVEIAKSLPHLIRLWGNIYRGSTEYVRLRDRSNALAYLERAPDWQSRDATAAIFHFHFERGAGVIPRPSLLCQLRPDDCHSQ